MRRAWTSVVCVAIAVATTTCGDDDGPQPVDAGRQDAGPDRCFPNNPANAAGLVGCNGGIVGPRPPNEYGGTCQARIEDPDDPRGTCDEGLVCYRSATSTRGLCLAICPDPPFQQFYVASGGCPDGSRCFALGPMSLCFPDCTTAGECSTGFCDVDQSCAVGTAPPQDGGPPDDAGDQDGGVADAGDEDASTDDDAGPTDAGARDGGPIDAGPTDAGTRDGGPIDAAAIDSGPPDAATSGDGSADGGSTLVDASRD